MTAITKRASNDLDTIFNSFKEEFGDYFDTDNLGSNQENDAVQKKSQIFKDLLATIDVYSVGEVNFDTFLI
jgi:hypothetical protein